MRLPAWRAGLLHRLDIREGERWRLGLLSLAAFCVISAHYFLKPASKSFFLAAQGSKGLPEVYIAVALVTGFVGIVQAWAGRRASLGLLVNAAFILLVGGIAGFRLAIGDAPGPGLARAFYIFASTYGVMAPAMLWLVANQVFEPRQARRLLGYVGAGAIGGGIAGGWLAHLLLPMLGTANLLWGAAAFVAVALVCLDLALASRRGSTSRDRTMPSGQPKGTLRLVLTHGYLRQLAGLIAVGMVVATLSEYLFLWAVETHVAPGQATTDFVARWYSLLNLACLPLQLLVTAPLLRRYGVGPALMSLPIVLTCIAGGMAIWPVLAFGTAMKVGESALRYSVAKSAIEILYLPLPPWLNERAKVFVDTVVDRLAKGGAGILLAILLHSGGGVRAVAIATAFLCLSWTGLAARMKRLYVEAFRDALAQGSVDLSTARIRLDETGALTAVGHRLSHESPTAVRHALDVLLDAEGADLRRIEPRLLALAGAEEPFLARRALRLLARTPSREALATARARLDDSHPGVAAAAAEVIASGEIRPHDFLAQRARAGKGKEALAAAALVVRGIDVPDAVVERLLVDWTPEGDVARASLAEAIAQGRLPARRELLRRLMADPVDEVAIEAIRGAGQLRDPELVPFLVAELRRPARRAAARAALAEMGETVVPALEMWIFDERVEAATRQRLPRALAQIGGDAAHRALSRALALEDPHLRHQVLKALNRLGRDGGPLIGESTLRAQLIAECRYLASLLAVQAASPHEGGPHRRLFERALAGSVRAARQRAFRVLGLRGAGRDWANAFAGLVSDDARRRSSAIEFADGSLSDRVRALLVPLIDDVNPAEAVRRASKTLGVEPLGEDAALIAVASGPDTWLATCALHVAAEERRAAVLPIAQQRQEDGNIWVRDAAQAVLAQVAAT